MELLTLLKFVKTIISIRFRLGRSDEGGVIFNSHMHLDFFFDISDFSATRF